jgi:hypothetical protein
MSIASGKELIIPQKDGIYADLSAMARAGLIKSVNRDYFNSNAIMRYEAASYIAEAAANVSQTAGDAGQFTSYYGNVKSISPDVYSIGMNIYDWNLTTGVFWEDITYFIAAQGQFQRIGIFDRDIYAPEETTEAHFEYIFRNYFQNRDARWLKHVWNGFEINRNGLFGRDTHFMNLPMVTGGDGG